MQKVRAMRIVSRTIQYGAISFLSAYIGFYFWFMAFQTRGFDLFFLFCIIVPILYLLCEKWIEYRDPSPFLIKLNKNLWRSGIHACAPTKTQEDIVKTFFDEKKWEMPFLFTVNEPEINLSVGSFCGKTILCITEQTFWKCTPKEIWTMLAHEKGHLDNGDIFRIFLENYLFLLCHLLSILSIIKIFGHVLLYSPNFPYPYAVYLFALFGNIYFFAFLNEKLQKVLYLVKEILADNSAAQLLGSAEEIRKVIQMLKKENTPMSSRREKALHWILKDK